MFLCFLFICILRLDAKKKVTKEVNIIKCLLNSDIFKRYWKSNVFLGATWSQSQAADGMDKQTTCDTNERW